MFPFLRYKRPLLVGFIVAAFIASLTQYLTYQQYLIDQDTQQSSINKELNTIKDKLNTTLGHALSATKTLAYIVEKYGVPREFDSAAIDILASVKNIDVLELTRKGKITHVYPLEGNESVIGYDILEDPKTNKEAYLALERKELYFAGPLNLKQGGVAVIGRLPIFIKGKFWGFSVVIIKLSTLLKALGIDYDEQAEFYYQLSKINPTNSQEEFFLSTYIPDDRSQVASIDIPEGGWKIYVLSKKRVSYFNIIVISVFGLVLSITGGSLVWYLMREPEKLNRLIEEKTLQLTQSERYYRTLINNNFDAIILVDASGKIAYQSPAAARITGYALHDVNARGGLRFIDPNAFGKDAALFNQFASTKEAVWHRITPIKHKDGHEIWIEGTYKNLLHDETINAIIYNYRDITDRFKAETALAKQTEEIRKLSMVASQTDNVVIITDAEEKIEWINESFVKLTGYQLEEVLGKTPRILQGPATDRSTLDKINKAIKAAEPISVEVLNYSKQGREFWLQLNINPAFNAKGILTHFIAIEMDITAQKTFERKIISVAKELSALIENANAVIFGVDRNGCLNEWNREAIHLTGYSRNEVLGKKLSRFVLGKKSTNRVDEIIASVMQGELINQFEIEFKTKHGEKLILLLSANPRSNDVGEAIGLIAVGQDVTELTQYRISLEEKVKERTEELREALRKEKELTHLKTQFVSMVSHEFRTPLSSIALSASFIKRYKSKIDDAVMDDKITTVLQQVTHMTNMLEDVLALGKTEEHGVQIKLTKVNMMEFMSNLKEQMIYSVNGSHSINSTLNFSESEIETDEGLLRNIFVNLIGNAIKFSPDHDAIYLHGYESENNLVIEVADRGIGIPESDIIRIFDPFDRGSNLGTIPGTGLGLAIVKRAVELLGGSISVTSTVGEGSVFTVTLPRFRSN